MKKFLSILLAAIICVTSLTPVFADDSSIVSELILKMKNLFSISDEEFVFVDYSKSDYSRTVTYSLTWESRADDTYERKPYISIEVEEDGDVIYYQKGYTSYQTPALPKFTEDEAIAKSKEYIEMIAPDRVLQIDSGDLRENSQYMVEFERVENGIPAHGNSISIDLNPETLELVSYNAHWSDVDFPSLDKAISREDALKAYADNIGYEAVYNISTEANKIKEIYTSYVPKAPRAFIDPFTGKATTHAELIYASATGAMNDKALQEESLARLSPEELQMIEEIKQMISKEDAEKLVRSISEFDIRKDAAVESFSISKNQYGEYIAHITFRADTKDSYYSVNIGINAKTKEIIAFSKYRDYDSNTPKYDPDKAQKKALAFIEKYYGEKFAKTKPQFTVGNKDDYSFTFDRYENGIRVKGNAISVRVNQYTGEIISVSCTWANAEFPTPDIKVTKEDIYNRILTDENYRLQYNIVTEYIYDSKTGKDNRVTTVHPVYAVMESPLFATDTLREIDYNGKPVTEKFGGYADTNGHYCHEAAAALGKFGIYFEGEKLMPDKAVTQKEFLELMYIAMYGWRNDNVYKALIRDGVMTEDEIAENITRMDAIRFIINAMEYKEVAELNGIYNCTFTDVEEDMKGYAAIAGGFGLVNTSTDTLRANDLMTRAECITILYNYLKR